MLRKSIALLLVFGILISAAALAQIDPGEINLFQDRRHVGVIWVPDRLPDACEYQEHWYLFAGYAYPGRDQPIETVIRPGEEWGFETVAEFEAVMALEYPGGHHVTVVAIEHRADCR